MKCPAHIRARLIGALLLAGIACAQPVRAQDLIREGGDDGGHAGGSHMIEPSATEPGFVHLELPGVFARDFTVRFVDDTMFVPFTAFSNALGILNHVSEHLDTLSGEMPLGQPFTIALGTGIFLRRNQQEQLPPRSVVVADGEVFVEARTLSRYMRIQTAFDLSELKFEVVPDARIPAVALARNRHLYAALSTRENGAEHERSAIRRELVGSAALRWSVLNTVQHGETNSAGLLQVAGPFLYGVLTASGSGRYSSVEHRKITGGMDNIGWQVQFPDFAPLRSLSAEATRNGDMASLLLRLGNAPLGGRREFGMHVLQGHAQPGWDVELYQDQTLVEVTQADEHGAYNFQVPVGYGYTTRTIHQVGPRGERIIEQRTFRLNPALIPPGEVQYNTSFFSESARIDRSVRGDMDIEFGVLEWMTLGSALSLRSPNIHSLHSDSLNVTALANFWLGDATPLALAYNPRSQSIGGTITYMFSDNFAVQAGIDSFNLRHRDAIIANGSFDLGLGWLTVGGAGQILNNDRITSVTVSPQLSFYLGGIGVNSSAKFMWLKSRGVQGENPAQRSVVSTVQITAAPLNGVFTMARASFDHTSNMLMELDLSSSLALSSALSLGLSYSAQRSDWQHGTVSAQLSYAFDAARIGIGATYQHGNVVLANNMEGGMVFSRGGVKPTSYEAINQAGVILHAFHDANLNGIQDGDEETLHDASADLSGTGGQFHTDNGVVLSLSPYQQSVITITHERFAARGLYPRRSEYAIYTLPASTIVIDVPFAEGFDVTGRCRMTFPTAGNREGSPTILTAMRIHLIATNGSAEYEGEVFDDGSLLIEGVSRGEYRIAFNEEQLDARRLRLIDLTHVVALSSTATALPTITFAPREGTAPGEGAVLPEQNATNRPSRDR